MGDQLQARNRGRLRRRGPQPTLSDSEVITMELVGELRKLGTDRDLFRHFRRYHQAALPAPAALDRTTFARQAANLWRVKRLIQGRRARALCGGDPVWLVDSRPIDACQRARARFCRRFAGQADYGYCHRRTRAFYGSRLHLRGSRAGVILAYQLAPARASERAVPPALGLPAGTTGIGDRGYWSPALRQRLAAGGVALLAPCYRKSQGPEPARSARLAAVRYRLETTNGQRAERYGIKRTWAKDLWHLCHRPIRKVLSHTALVYLTFRAGWPPLSFDRPLAA